MVKLFVESMHKGILGKKTHTYKTKWIRVFKIRTELYFEIALIFKNELMIDHLASVKNAIFNQHSYKGLKNSFFEIDGLFSHAPSSCANQRQF